MEVLGTVAPQADAEVILMLWTFLTKLGLASRTQAAMWAVREGLVDAAETRR